MIDRECRRIRKLRRRVRSDENLEAAIIRPKHMRQATFEPIFEEIIARETRLMNFMDQRLAKSLHSLRPQMKEFWS